MASEPPMSLRMAATASAWARVFSPVSSCSEASSGSAKARARASACAWWGKLSEVAATMAEEVPRPVGATSGVGAPTGGKVASERFISTQRVGSYRPHKFLHHGDLIGDQQGWRVTDAGEFNTARLGAALTHLGCGVPGQQIGVSAPQQQGGRMDGVIQLPERAFTVLHKLQRGRLFH